MSYRMPDAAVTAWLREQGVTAEDTFRFTVDRAASTIRVYQYERDLSKERRFFIRYGEIAERVPFTVSVETIPDFVEFDSYGKGE